MSHTPPIKLDRGKCAAALGDQDTPGMVILIIAMHAFGDKVLGDPYGDEDAMDPSELWAGLNELYGTWVTEEGENKFNALVMALQGDLFYRDTEVFSSCCAALFDGDLGDMIDGDFSDLTAVEVMWGMLEVDLARETNDDRPEFSHGVRAIIDAAIAGEQENQDENTIIIREAYQDLLRRLHAIGVPVSALRLLDQDYADVIEQASSPAANPVLAVS